MRYKEKTMKPNISGLNTSGLNYSAARLSTAAGPSLPSFPTTASSDNGDASDDDTASLDGDRILATKDRHELAEEVALLKKMLRAKHRREQALRSWRSNKNNDTVGDISDECGNDSLEMGLKEADDADDEMDITDTTRTMNNLSGRN
ncbi:MAG: hypothetical protein SGARI_005021, partial [Bacillariaceae sp.]